jgi:iron complex transport system substrate-binding protein
MVKQTQRHLGLFLAVFILVITLSTCQNVALVAHPNQPTPACYPIRHEMGTSCIPHAPQRVIAMDQESLEMLIALGIKPIAMASSNLVGNKTRVLRGKLDGIVDLGKEEAPNFERMVQLHPDLIIGSWLLAGTYQLLTHIAPTLPIQRYEQIEWKKAFIEFAQILHRQTVAQQLLADYQSHVNRLQTALVHQQKSFCLIRFYTDVGLTQFYNQHSFAVNVIEDVAVLKIPPVQRLNNQPLNFSDGYINISQENIDWLDADIMFVALDPGAEASFHQYSQSPLWQTLKVVQQQRVYSVDSGYWNFGSVLSAQAILDDVAQILLSEAPPHPVP